MSRQQVSCNPNFLKSLVLLLGFCLTAYILGPPLYWHLAEGFVALSRTSCAPCVCDCAYEPILSLPSGFSNTTFTDCEKKDPDVSEEMEKNFVDLLSEELKLQEATALENQQRSDIALLEAKKLASQYQKEADKCNSGMETCEETREKSDATLVAQKKLTELWEKRARKRDGKMRWRNPKPVKLAPKRALTRVSGPYCLRCRTRIFSYFDHDGGISCQEGKHALV